jgi:hypothetical protein
VFWLASASRLRTDFGNFHQRLQRMQEDTGRNERPGLSDTLIRKGNAEPLKMSGFGLRLFDRLPISAARYIKKRRCRVLTNRLPQHGGIPNRMKSAPFSRRDWQLFQGSLARHSYCGYPQRFIARCTIDYNCRRSSDHPFKRFFA